MLGKNVFAVLSALSLLLPAVPFAQGGNSKANNRHQASHGRINRHNRVNRDQVRGSSNRNVSPLMCRCHPRGSSVRQSDAPCR
jgi:hypothetical protein